MSDLPPGWEWTTLQDLAAAEPRAMTDGPFGSNLKSAHYVDSGPRVIRLQNVGFGKFVDEKAHITESHFETLRAHEARSGDLVVASLGQDLPRACIVPPTLGPAIVKADCIRVRIHPSVDASYVNYALQRPALRHAVADQIHGVGRPRLGMAGIKELSVPLSPRAAQERIVAAIEEHLSRLDAAEETILRSRSRLEGLWRATLRSEISAASGVEGASLVSFDAAFVPVGSPGSIAQSDYLRHGPLAVIDQGAGLVGGYTDDLAARVDTELPVVVFGDHTRRLKFIDFPFAVGASGTKVLRPVGDLNARFAYYALSDVDLENRGYGRHYSLLRKASVPIPPESAQYETVRALDEAREDFDRMVGTLDSVLIRVASLRRGILAAAFSGQLVPQDPDDEPASMLLERIRADRAAAATTKRTRKAKAS